MEKNSIDFDGHPDGEWFEFEYPHNDGHLEVRVDIWEGDDGNLCAGAVHVMDEDSEWQRCADGSLDRFIRGYLFDNLLEYAEDVLKIEPKRSSFGDIFGADYASVFGIKTGATH